MAILSLMFVLLDTVRHMISMLAKNCTTPAAFATTTEIRRVSFVVIVKKTAVCCLEVKFAPAIAPTGIYCCCLFTGWFCWHWFWELC